MPNAKSWRSHAAAAFLLSIGVATLCVVAPAQDKKPPVPDLTRGGKKSGAHDWTLGPTGARGWIWGWKGQTTDARQILITEVAPQSPAEGRLLPDDVVVGIDGRPFKSDARVALAEAIAAAETEARGGRLKLLVARKAETQAVEVALPGLGAYAPTAPYDCPKSRLILERGAAAIAARGFNDKRGRVDVSIENDMNALALLAAGIEAHRPLVDAYAKAVAAHQPGGHISWGYAYQTLFLAEYALAVKNPAVMPGLRRLALDIARGQSVVGTWGHAFARPGDAILEGYGAMNQPGIVLLIALAIAREAGVRDPVVDRALAKGSAFLRWYVDKGAVPYGDHDPWPWHDDNGKCSSAAVLFDLLGDQEATAFFAKMATAAHAERESGHTGNFFNVLWAMPGVARAGPNAVAAYWREQSWYYDLARGSDFRLRYQPTPDDWNGDSFDGWDTTGAYLLAYALPLRRIVLTGSRPSAMSPLSKVDADRVIEAGRDFSYWNESTCYDDRSIDRLFEGLASWSPAVRTRSAAALGRRGGDHLVRLDALLAAPETAARYGALEALAELGTRADAAAPKLREALLSADPWIQSLAARALARLGKEARIAAVPDLLAALVRDNPADPRRRAAGALGEALFSTAPGKNEPRPILERSLEGVARPALHAALRAVLANEDGRIRGYAAPIYRRLDPADVAALLPEIIASVATPARSGEMFAFDIRMAGVELLAHHRIAEGLELALFLMNESRWGRDLDRAARALAAFGQAAAPLLERVDKETAPIAKKEGERQSVALASRVAEIRASTDARPVVLAADFRRLHLTSETSDGALGSVDAKLPVKVFILAGQSNMEGFGAISAKDDAGRERRGTLLDLLADPKRRDMVKHLVEVDPRAVQAAPTAPRWAKRNDVWVAFGERHGALAPGFGANEKLFGAELGFGHVVGAALENQVLIVKTAWGGKSLFQDFRPPSAGGAVGPNYRLLVDSVRATLADLKTLFPAYDSRGYEIAGLVWWHGWNDGCDPKRAVPEYEANLVHLIRDLRKEFALPKLPVVVCELTGPWVEAPDEWAVLRRAQEAACKRPEFAGNVFFVRTRDFVRKEEESPGGWPAHEFNNAETYYLVGRAAARALYP